MSHKAKEMRKTIRTILVKAIIGIHNDAAKKKIKNKKKKDNIFKMIEATGSIHRVFFVSRKTLSCL